MYSSQLQDFMKKRLTDLFGPEKTPEELYSFAVEPTEDDIDLYLQKKGYQSPEWQEWFEQYFNHFPEKKSLAETFNPTRPIEEQEIFGFKEKFPSLVNELEKSVLQHKNLSLKQDHVPGSVWDVKTPVGIFRGKPVVIANVFDEGIIGFPLTWHDFELWYANDQDLILQPEDWDQHLYAFISAWNPQILQKGQLKNEIGKLTGDARNEMLIAFASSIQLRSPVQATDDFGRKRNIDWIMKHHKSPREPIEKPSTNFQYGQSILSENDPRNRYACNETLLLNYMSTPFFENSDERQTEDDLKTGQKRIELSRNLPNPNTIETLSENFLGWIQQARSSQGKEYYREIKHQGVLVKPEQMAAAGEIGDTMHPVKVKPIQNVEQDLEIHLNPSRSGIKIEVGGTSVIEMLIVRGPHSKERWSLEKPGYSELISADIPYRDLEGMESIHIQVVCKINDKSAFVFYPPIYLP